MKDTSSTGCFIIVSLPVSLHSRFSFFTNYTHCHNRRKALVLFPQNIFIIKIHPVCGKRVLGFVKVLRSLLSEFGHNESNWRVSHFSSFPFRGDVDHGPLCRCRARKWQRQVHQHLDSIRTGKWFT